MIDVLEEIMNRKITLYALSTCTHCHNVGTLLEELLGPKGFTHIYVDRLSGDERNITMRALRTKNPEMSFPTTVIGDRVITGEKLDVIRKLVEEASPQK